MCHARENKKYIQNVAGFEVLTAVTMKRPIFWNIRPCRTVKVSRCFGEACSLNIQGRRASQVRNQQDLLAAFFRLVSSTLKM
jgi:hypothetical protein